MGARSGSKASSSRPASVSEAVDLLVWQLRATDHEPVLEYRFHPERRWRFDLAFPDALVAVEVDGGAWVQGRHTSGAGFEADCVKLSHAAALGWRVLRVTPRMVRDGLALTLVLAALAYPKIGD